MEMAHSLLGVLVAFLHSFQRKVERFLEAPAEVPPPDGASGRAMALLNCCPPFRAFAERLAQFGHPESEDPRRQAHTALDKVMRLCNHVLTQHLFEDLKVKLGCGAGGHPWGPSVTCGVLVPICWVLGSIPWVPVLPHWVLSMIPWSQCCPIGF
ncbi:exocyst complex component 3-like protein 2 [Numida meleagris]|uniref:exocyst complex component 3-like protein 2 n=1 Tax=Numida meleagris TaxID=8996 RepID=UPI000B3E2D90|nr:exocyst complex component 3-like protein 2 [Numida meleagris]